MNAVVRVLVASSILLPAGAAASHAQVVRGTVADSATAKLLDSARVSLIGGDGHVARVLTDSSGQFALSARAPGRHVVQIERLGYRTVRTEPFAVAARAEISLTVLLSPAAVGLKAVTVTAAPEEEGARYLERSGYLERRRSGQGVYLDGTDLEERRSRALEFSDVLRAIPGVSMMALGDGKAVFRLRGMESMYRPCEVPLVYLDGMVLEANDPVTLNSIVSLDHLLAIELYRGPSTVPSQYGGADSGCGVILIWTRHSSR